MLADIEDDDDDGDIYPPKSITRVLSLYERHIIFTPIFFFLLPSPLLFLLRLRGLG